MTEMKVTRRNAIKGVIAAGAVSSAGYLFRTNTVQGQASAPGSVERLITLNVNGQQRRVDVMKQETLAMTLRYKLGLTGTKLGCDRAECGACTVLIDDVPHYSCSVLTHTVRGKKIQTIEGLASADGKLHPVQQGVVEEQGFQCAFCMSGFVMATVGFLKTNPNPTRAELAHGVSGNLCRCQDYDKILTALMRGAETFEEGVTMPKSRSEITRPMPQNRRRSQADRQKLSDPRPHRQGDGKVEIRRRLSRRRHALLQTAAQPRAPRHRPQHRYDRDALAMPGVKAILTQDDLPPPADSITDNGTVIPANPRRTAAWRRNSSIRANRFSPSRPRAN